MGLGKTLTMIAAILGSHDRAEEYRGQNKRDTSQQSPAPDVPLFLKATLIVVPSERESNEIETDHWNLLLTHYSATH